MPPLRVRADSSIKKWPGLLGDRVLAGHAPEFLTPTERLARWMGSTSDLRISLYMLALAFAVAAILYLVNQRLFA